MLSTRLRCRALPPPLSVPLARIVHDYRSQATSTSAGAVCWWHPSQRTPPTCTVTPCIPPGRTGCRATGLGLPSCCCCCNAALILERISRWLTPVPTGWVWERMVLSWCCDGQRTPCAVHAGGGGVAVAVAVAATGLQSRLRSVCGALYEASGAPILIFTRPASHLPSAVVTQLHFWQLYSTTMV